MIDNWPVFVTFAVGLFLIGTIVGSFLNLCIARLPFEQSVFWPSSRCDACGVEVSRKDLIPILGWLRLGGKSRCCNAALLARYPFIEFLTGLLFVAVLVVDSITRESTGASLYTFWMAVVAHCLFLAVLVVVSFIDFDYTIVPAPVTNFGIAVGLLMGVVAPGYRPEPSHASTPMAGLVVGLIGLAVAVGLVWSVRFLGGIIFRREAMGLGDVHILGVVGAVCGWQIAVLSFFLSSFYGLIPSLWKFVPFLWKRLTGREWRSSEREIPLGPFLSMAAATFLLLWPWLWPSLLKPYFMMMEWLVRFLLGQEVEI